MKLTIYSANCVGNAANAIYPNKAEVENKEDMMAVISRDHVCGKFKNCHRSIDDFLSSDVEVMDCDNEHSDNPEDWITAEKYEELFPDVSYILVPSRNDGKVKGKRSARPRHHIYFPHSKIANADEVAGIKTRLQEYAPFFDDNALDAARFIFGCNPSDIVWHEGSRNIDEFLEEMDFAEYDQSTQSIGEGSRNSTMSHIAGRLIKRYGNTEKAHDIYLEKAQLCSPPLEDSELALIWSSAVKFGKKVQAQVSYVSPEDFNKGFSLKPDDYSDIGQAKVLSREYAGELAFTDSTDYMRYDGTHWVESKQLAVGACEEFLDEQLKEATAAVEKAKKMLLDAGVDKEVVMAGGKALEKVIDESSEKAFKEFMMASKYYAFVMKRRDMKFVTSALQAAKPMLLKKITDFDSQEFLLNTPIATYDLRDGSSKGHAAEDLITKITAVSPGTDGMDLWLDALDSFFCSDKELIEYVQQIVGLSAIGKVYVEALVIAYGEGSNGKSTFWNTIARVLGTYSGTISADALTVGCKRNVKPEMAELKGKRLVIAAELEEGMRLNTSIVKQLCSTDEVTAEKKYKDPFKYVPTHTLVLYTNHLPKVGANDDGIWRRLIVIPFNAKITGSSDRKNYADYLYEQAGGAVLSWIIDGAEKAIKNRYKLKTPIVVEAAINKYRENNDWLSAFAEECCEVDITYTQKSGEFYQEYRSYCARTGEYTRSTTDFYAALENAGFERKKTKAGIIVRGIRLKSDFLDS
ncbi:MAG: phage/plasmid primase, P4 family [Dorea formicigenerans]|nr:phage/plasmid primase, P4 family [Dorea formicigenerans]DAQ50405.1 MAG TPA: dsDNA helicase [Caudoviricetes sp.]